MCSSSCCTWFSFSSPHLVSTGTPYGRSRAVGFAMHWPTCLSPPLLILGCTGGRSLARRWCRFFFLPNGSTGPTAHSGSVQPYTTAGRDLIERLSFCHDHSGNSLSVISSGNTCHTYQVLDPARMTCYPKPPTSSHLPSSAIGWKEPRR